jgi:hypothetical protein
LEAIPPAGAGCSILEKQRRTKKNFKRQLVGKPAHLSKHGIAKKIACSLLHKRERTGE